MNQRWIKKFIGATLLIGMLLLAMGWWQHSEWMATIAGLITMFSFCMGLLIPDWSGYRFTFWMLIANIGAMVAPQWFQNVGGFSLTNSWLMLIVIQAIMFGMGTQMSVRDFCAAGDYAKRGVSWLIVPIRDHAITWGFFG